MCSVSQKVGAVSKKPVTDAEKIADLQKKLADAHAALDQRNKATMVWIKGDTNTRAFCHKLENVLRAHGIDYLNDPAFTEYNSPLQPELDAMNALA